MNMMKKGAVAVVTGGATGIGKALVEQLAEKGLRVVIVGRRKEVGEPYAASLRDAGYDAQCIALDMTDVQQVAQLFSRLETDYDRIDYFFNNAGSYMGGEMRDTPIESWHQVMQNNVASVMNGVQAAYTYMLRQGTGHIINVASAAGLFPAPILGIYGATKFAIVGLTHSLRTEASALNIHVSVACPTVVDTPLYDGPIRNKFDVSKTLGNRKNLQSPETAAARILKGVKRNKATIHTSVLTHGTWLVYKWWPALYFAGARQLVKKYRATLRQDG